MPCCLNLILILAYLKYVLLAPDRKFVYQKDMSEYCRRRVMPSVFLGRHVVGANSEILHFAKLDMPYSCFISVRSEAGNNVILVIQMVSDENLINSCTESNSQLLVYEMGETFGGYWGPLPDTLLQQKRTNTTKYYTLKTTPMTTTDNISPIEEVNEDDYKQSNITLLSEVGLSNVRQDPDTEDFISIELPIVNVSGSLIPGESPPRSAYGLNDAFENIYDVAPRGGTQYDTSVLPLVQFSIEKQLDSRRVIDTGDKDLFKYQMDYNIPFTPDMRLTYYAFNNPTTYKRVKLFPKQKFSANRRLNFKKNRAFSVTSHTQLFHKRNYSNLTTKRQSTGVQSWLLIDNFMRTLNKTTVLDDKSKNESEFSYLLQRISNLKHNSSVYLSPNLSVYDNKFTSHTMNTTTVKQIATTAYSPYRFLDSPEDSLISNMTTVVNTKIIAEDIAKTTPSLVLTKLSNDSSNSITIKDNFNINSFHYEENITTAVTAKGNNNDTNISSTQFDVHTSADAHIIEKPITGSLVDHESWENLVQIAPVMAVVLKQTVKMEGTTNNYSDLQKTTVTNYSNIKREKRYIHSIPIQIARPHFLAPMRDKGTTSGVTYNIEDMQEFAQLVELQDDEMHGRVALRYLRQYVGPAQFNICDYNGATHRNVYMFNSSRIVIAISNFTLDRMAVVLTPARTLYTSDARCSQAHLECQVSGVRVCIDSTSACDGVPNCGSYDIYDEDRLMCGVGLGLQRNVYLAAVTFMAVVLTVLYIVHYWLKRCVSRVSEAFFVYTNGAENELYLDTIMRSPNDDNDSSKLSSNYQMYHGDTFKDVVTDSNIHNEPGISAFKRCLKSFILCQCFRRKRKDKDLQQTDSDSDLHIISLAEKRKIYSFTELEIRKMTGQQFTNTAVQTGESLEMKCIENKKNVKPNSEVSQIPKTSESETSLDTFSILTLEKPHRQQYAEELNIMKFLRDTRSDSVGSFSMDDTCGTKMSVKSSNTGEEKEIHNHEYKTHGGSASMSGTSMITSYDCLERPGPSGLVKKQLRFEEEATLIPCAEQDTEDNKGSTSERRSVVLGVAKLWRNVDLDTIEEGDEHSSNTTRDHRRFWGLSKKSKK